MKPLFLTMIIAVSLTAFSQKLSTRNGYVRFFSDAPLEDIEAINKQVSSVIDLETGSFAFLVPIKGFTFEKALMQEHFNENYMESSKFPHGAFKGTLENADKIDLSKDGTYELIFKGTMAIHGVEKSISEKASLTIKDGKASLNAKFTIRPEDYNVKIPAGKKDNISETLEVTVKMDYDKP